MKRPAVEYDPARELSDRFPGWDVICRPYGPEATYFPGVQVVVLRTSGEPAEEQVARVVAHLSLGHLEDDSRHSFTGWELAQAEWLVQVWLGQPCDWQA